MSEDVMKRSSSVRRSSKRRRRRKSSISITSFGGYDDDSDSVLKMFENNENDEDLDLQDNNNDAKEEEGSNDSSPKTTREKRREEMEKRIREELLLEKIKQCKDLIENVKNQSWKISKKLEIHRKAVAYVEKHEGNLSGREGYQQRGRQLMKQALRSWNNWVASLVPWEMKIKQIESHFGSVVASYFVFLRWLIWISVWLALLPTCFIIIPEGILKYSVLFYGYYGGENSIGRGYRLPLAYLLTNLAIFAYSFITVLRIMANNSRQSRMSNKDEEFPFSWRLFTEWDYMIGSHDTATTKHASITTTFKETILEEQVKTKDDRNWQLLVIRVLANFLIVVLLALSTYAIQLCVVRSRELDLKKQKNEDYVSGYWEENELTVVVTLISSVFPGIFDIVAIVEKCHPRTSLRLMLGRIFVLNLINVYTLFIALYYKMDDLLVFLSYLERNATEGNCTGLLHNLSMTGVTDVTTAATSPVNILTLTQDLADAENFTEPRECVNQTVYQQSIKQLCWETMIGQEVFKLTVMDTVVNIGQLILVDVFRVYFVKYFNNLCCWDMEKSFPQYPEFKTAENLLQLISNQGVIWLGALFSPGLPLLNLIKLYIFVYARCWTVMIYNVPEERIFRASRSNNFYYALLLIMLFLCMLPPLFAIVAIEPSPGCGPFSGHPYMYSVLTDTIRTELPSSVTNILNYAASPGLILPLFMLLGMIIYYMISTGRSLKDANNELRMQLEYERTEGRKKVYAMAGAKNEAKEKAKAKGWKTAKAKILPRGGQGVKHKGIADVASAATKITSDPNNLGINEERAVKTSFQLALETLLQAKGHPSIPVAVIKGKQSSQAGASSIRERQAALEDFKKALIECALWQQTSENQESRNYQKGIKSHSVWQNKTAKETRLKRGDTKQKGDISDFIKRPDDYNRQQKESGTNHDTLERQYRQEGGFTRSRKGNQTKKRFNGTSAKSKQPDDDDADYYGEVIEAGGSEDEELLWPPPLRQGGSQKVQHYFEKLAGKRRKFEPVTPSETNSGDQQAIQKAVFNRTNRKGGFREGKTAMQSNDHEEDYGKGARNLRRRLSTSSMVDETGHLKLVEDSDSWDENDNDDDDEYQSNFDGNTSMVDETDKSAYSDEHFIDINGENNRPTGRRGNIVIRNPAVPKNKTPPLPSTKSKKGKGVSFQPPVPPKQPKLNARNKLIKARVEYIDESPPPRPRQNQQSAREKLVLQRSNSNSSVTGSVPEITIEDFSETTETNDEQGVSKAWKNAPNTARRAHVVVRDTESNLTVWADAPREEEKARPPSPLHSPGPHSPGHRIKWREESEAYLQNNQYNNARDKWDRTRNQSTNIDEEIQTRKTGRGVDLTERERVNNYTNKRPKMNTTSKNNEEIHEERNVLQDIETEGLGRNRSPRAAVGRRSWKRDKLDDGYRSGERFATGTRPDIPEGRNTQVSTAGSGSDTGSIHEEHFARRSDYNLQNGRAKSPLTSDKRPQQNDKNRREEHAEIERRQTSPWKANTKVDRRLETSPAAGMTTREQETAEHNNDNEKALRKVVEQMRLQREMRNRSETEGQQKAVDAGWRVNTSDDDYPFQTQTRGKHGLEEVLFSQRNVHEKEYGNAGNGLLVGTENPDNDAMEENLSEQNTDISRSVHFQDNGAFRSDRPSLVYINRNAEDPPYIQSNDMTNGIRRGREDNSPTQT